MYNYWVIKSSCSVIPIVINDKPVPVTEAPSVWATANVEVWKTHQKQKCSNTKSRKSNDVPIRIQFILHFSIAVRFRFTSVDVWKFEDQVLSLSFTPFWALKSRFHCIENSEHSLIGVVVWFCTITILSFILVSISYQISKRLFFSLSIISILNTVVLQCTSTRILA